MSEHAVAAQESHKATGCTDCVQPVFVWILKCSGEPCSPLRVRCTRLHALRAKLNTQFMLYQNILYKHKYSSSGRPMNAPTGLQSKKSIKKRPPYWVDTLCVGISLFFRAVASQVSSAPLSLTSVFGMGTGGPSASSTPTILLYLKAFQLFYLLVTRAGIEPALPA